MNQHVEFEELLELIKNYFKQKKNGKVISIRSVGNSINCLFYNSFIFKCEIEEPRNNFAAALFIEGIAIVEFFGEKISLNNTEEDILKSLELVDKYCQLRLPDKYLQEYFKGINN